MHILLTGGTGLIGSALIKRGRQHDYRFTVLTRQRLKSREHVNYIHSLDDIALNTRFNAAVNLAGEPIADKRWSENRKQTLIKSRVGTTQLLVDLLAKLAFTPPVLVSGSAVGWYGDQKNREVTEETPPTREFTHELCELWEETAKEAERFDTRVCLLRTGLVIAEEGGFLQKMLPPFRFGLGGRLGSGNQYMPWVHIQDIVSMILFLIQNENCEGPFNGTAPVPVPNSTFTNSLGNELGRPTLLPVPEFVLKTILGEMSRLLLTGQNAIPKKFTEAGYKFIYPDLKSALKDVL